MSSAIPFGTLAGIVMYYAVGYVADAMQFQQQGLLIAAQFMAAMFAKQFVDNLFKVSVVGKPAPEIKDLQYYQGTPVELGNGHVTVVEFWATWCPPCRTSIKHLNETYAKYKAQGVGFVGVTNETSQAITTYKNAGVHPFPAYPIGLDHSNCCKGYPREGIPAAFVVGTDGTVTWQGHPMSGLDAAINAALAKGRPVEPPQAAKFVIDQVLASAKVAEAADAAKAASSDAGRTEPVAGGAM